MTRRFAHHWLTVACVTTILVGLMCAFASHPATAEPWRLLFDVVRWPLDGVPAGFDTSERVLNAIIGGLMVGWAVMLLRLARLPDPPYRVFLHGLTAWFVVDSTGSMVAGVPGNVVLNASFYLMFLVPLWHLMRQGAP